MKRKRVHALLLLSLPTVVLAVAALLLMTWRVPARIQVDLTVEKATLTVGNSEPMSTRILNSVDFQAITFENFISITFQPEKLEIANPMKYDFAEDRFPESAWIDLALSDQKVSIKKRDDSQHPMVTLESAMAVSEASERNDLMRGTQGNVVTLEVGGDQNQRINIKVAGQDPRAVLSIVMKDSETKAIGTLDPIQATYGSEVALQVRDNQSQQLTIQVKDKHPTAILSTTLSIGEPFQLIADNCLVSDVDESQFHEEQSLTYRARLRSDNPFVELTGTGSLTIKVRIPPQGSVNLFSRAAIPVKALDFTRQDETGNRVSALIKGGEINYPDYPKIDKVSFQAPAFVGVHPLENFHITEISVDQKRNVMRFRLDGIARHIMTSTINFRKDHRLSLFDIVCQNPRLLLLFSIIVWVFPSTVGGYRLYKEVME